MTYTRHTVYLLKDLEDEQEGRTNEEIHEGRMTEENPAIPPPYYFSSDPVILPLFSALQYTIHTADKT